MEKQVKKVSRVGIDAFVTKQIRKGSRAPASFNKMKRLGKETATDLKVKGKKLKIPWGLLLVLIPGLIGIYLVITSIKRRKDGIAPGEKLDEPVNLRGKDADTLLGEFGHEKEKGQGEPGRPFN